VLSGAWPVTGREDSVEIPTLDRQMLARLVAKSTGATQVVIANWTTTPINSGGGEAAGIYRISGKAKDGDADFPWALILKILPARADAGEPSAWNYSQREALAYNSGLLDGLNEGLTAPCCLQIDTASDGTTWLWLEDVGNETEATWPLSRYGVAAYHLGRFNGSYSAGTALPAYPWLSRNWLRGWIGEAAPYIDVLWKHRDHPYVMQMYDVRHILRLWKDRSRRLNYLENLPQTLCHLDAYRGNLFSRRDDGGLEQTVAIDWAFVGHAALGEELSSLVVASVAMNHIEPGRMKELEATVLEGYLDGLNDEGCSVDPKAVYDAYALSASIRLPVGALRLVLPVLLAPADHRLLQQHGGTPLEELVQMWGTMNDYVRGLG
jgi:hypothetical protein